jgi:endonuclease/exonuclease/phosphatase family metal-dependent hydrolase
MRAIVSACVEALSTPPAGERMAAAAGPMTQSEHERWMQRWSCMHALEVKQAPPVPTVSAEPAKVVAWNLERCKHVEASASLIAARRADVVLATEMDWGCARSGQRHTTADLAAALGLGSVFGVEFVELALGDARETAEHAGEQNLHGLHGNAVLSRFPIGRSVLIPLDDGGLWFVSDLKQGQRRVGGRHAIAAEILAPAGAFWAVSAHFESQSTPDSRAAEARRLLDGLEEVANGAPIVIGGDFNVLELSRQQLSDEEMFAAPEKVEPSFANFRQAGFAWTDCNAPGTTTRPHPWQPQDKPRLRIDWLFARGMTGRRPWIMPALGLNGTVISDHDAIGAEFIL